MQKFEMGCFSFYKACLLVVLLIHLSSEQVHLCLSSATYSDYLQALVNFRGSSPWRKSRTFFILWGDVPPQVFEDSVVGAIFWLGGGTPDIF